jgi:hypothetical protein
MTTKISSINAQELYKGQVIPAELVWNHFIARKPDKYENWLTEYGDEETAKAARMAQVLLQVRDWLERDRRHFELPPLVMNTAGGTLNVLTDDKASSYLNDQAFQGLRRHQRATNRLLNAVDEVNLSVAGRREHQNRINVHSFIAASSQGAQKQLQVLKRAGKEAPKLQKG